MRDKNLNYIQFKEAIDSFLSKKTRTIEILRSTVVDNPTLLSEDYKLYFYSNNFIALRGLALLSYYVPEILGWKIRFYLEEYSDKLSQRDALKLKLMLHSKNNTLVYLYETEEFSSHEIFGNVLGEGLKLLKHMKIVRVKHKVVKPQRRRGYNDKGTLRSQDRWLPTEDYSLDLLQREIEKDRYTHKRMQLRLERYFKQRSDFYLEKYSSLDNKPPES